MIHDRGISIVVALDSHPGVQGIQLATGFDDLDMTLVRFGRAAAEGGGVKELGVVQTSLLHLLHVVVLLLQDTAVMFHGRLSCRKREVSGQHHRRLHASAPPVLEPAIEDRTNSKSLLIKVRES